MSRIYVTGDCHADFSKFKTRNFPEQKELSHKDFVIICGDFGIWDNCAEEKYRLNWLNKKPFTTLFVDGNHENFDRLYSNEFEIVRFHGGKAHKIRDNIYHLMRGHMFNICGKKIFAFGGAASHDIKDGILEPNDYKDTRSLIKDYNNKTLQGKLCRINHISWWKEEIPSDEEMAFGLQTLKKHNFKVDYVITHCCPQEVASYISYGFYKPDKLTSYFNKVDEKLDFNTWFFGHYHRDETIYFGNKYVMLYNKIMRVL